MLLDPTLLFSTGLQDLEADTIWSYSLFPVQSLHPPLHLNTGDRQAGGEGRVYLSMSKCEVTAWEAVSMTEGQDYTIEM